MNDLSYPALSRGIDHQAALVQWRHLIEPVIADSATPMGWDAVLHASPFVFSLNQSVLVCTKQSETTLCIWVAAGDLGDVLALIDVATACAKADGFKKVSYLGRKGWVKSAGFKQLAVYAVKEM